MGTVGSLIHERTDVLWDDAQHWGPQRAFDVVNSLHAGIEILDEEGEANAHEQADHNANTDIKRFSWRRGSLSLLRGVNDADNAGLGNGSVNFFLDDFQLEAFANELKAFKVAFCLPVRTAFNSLFDVVIAEFLRFLCKLIQMCFFGIPLG